MQENVQLEVPARAAYARSVRMMAANLAVVGALGVDDVEDLRMAAEEGFVYACATKPESCTISFKLEDGRVELEFSLGDDLSAEDPALEYSDLLLSALCDEYDIDEEARILRLVKIAGAVYDEQ